MSDIAAGSIDMILCDLPYGTTACKWDSIIPLDALWSHYKRIIKPNGAIVLTAQQPFSTVLGASNIGELRYEWIWEKHWGTGFFNVKRAPLKYHEQILVFYSSAPTYNPQMGRGKPYTVKRRKGSEIYANAERTSTVNTGSRYPRDILKFPHDRPQTHPTQKPVALFEYLIRTYTNEGETVLDNCAGSGTTAIAAMRANRRWICIEREPDYCVIIRDRIEKEICEKSAISSS